MCRFFGEVAFGLQKSDYKDFERVLRLSKPGGPDATQITEEGVCRMGYNRLAVLDLSERANQPMCSPSGRYLLSFNGEVYNHYALRGLCDNKSFLVTSDTEALAHCMDQFRVAGTISQLDGMFAIAVWDLWESTLHLCRDFAGIKPLYYGLNSNGVVFSSQYNQLALHKWFSNEAVNPEAFTVYLKRHYQSAPYGLNDHTYQVEPGQIVSPSCGTKQVTKDNYWRLPFLCKEPFTRPEDTLEWVDAALKDAVKVQMMSDVPLGTLLSGGVDAPLISYYVASESPQQLNTFTIGSDNVVYDESEKAYSYAESLHSQNLLYTMSDNAQTEALFGKSTKAICEPFADFTLIPTYLVSKLATSRVTVALSGDGADDFFGYERFWPCCQTKRSWINLG